MEEERKMEERKKKGVFGMELFIRPGYSRNGWVVKLSKAYDKTLFDKSVSFVLFLLFISKNKNIRKNKSSLS